MDTRTRIDFDELMRILSVIGFVSLATWVMSAAVGLLSGYAKISPSATLRFLLAVLILSFARRTYWELRQWRWSKLPPDERSGFSSPFGEQARSFAEAEDRDIEDSGFQDDGFVTATSPSQASA